VLPTADPGGCGVVDADADADMGRTDPTDRLTVSRMGSVGGSRSGVLSAAGLYGTRESFRSDVDSGVSGRPTVVCRTAKS
jgi:hypothetical protein